MLEGDAGGGSIEDQSAGAAHRTAAAGPEQGSGVEQFGSRTF
jgi:hypothetical protein